MMYRKDISLSFEDEKSLEMFINILTANVKVNMTAVSRMGHLYISLQGDPESVRRSIVKIKELYKIVKSSGRRTPTKYPVDMLLSMADLEAPIALDTVAIALSIWGYKAYVRGNHIVSDAPLELIIDTMSNLSHIYMELQGTFLTPPVKRLVAVCSTVSGKTPDECIHELAVLGLVRNVKGHHTLAVPYANAVEHLKAHFATYSDDKARHSKVR